MGEFDKKIWGTNQGLIDPAVRLELGGSDE